MVEVKKSCPLGHTCEKAVNGSIERCHWYTKILGPHPQTGKDVDNWGCAIAWLPILSLEMSRTNRGQTAALESFRNEMMKDNDEFMKLAAEKPDAGSLPRQ